MKKICEELDDDEIALIVSIEQMRIIRRALHAYRPHPEMDIMDRMQDDEFLGVQELLTWLDNDFAPDSEPLNVKN